MKARRFPRGVYRRGKVLWIRFKNADGKLTRESTRQRDVKVAESILAKRRSEVAMLSHFPRLAVPVQAAIALLQTTDFTYPSSWRGSGRR